MSTIIANINFLASLGIVNQDEFVAAFGDMTTFDAYCREIGYSWEIDENNNIILYSPKNKEIDSGVSVLITEEPNIVVTEGEEAYTIEAIGNGTVKLYADDIEVSNPVVFNREDEAQEITFTATAQEDGKLISDAVEEDITIPAKLPVTDTPVITITPSDASYEISAQGSGVVKLYADGVQVSNPYVVTRTNEDQEFIFTATAKAEGHVISEEAEEEVVVPALPITDTPVISYDSATFTVNVTGNGTVLAYVDGVQTQMPHTFTQGESEQTYVVTATAQEAHKQISAVATMSCVVPAAMKKNYMKLSALGDGDITINIPSQIDTSYATSLSYSKDGSNWTETLVDNTAQTITIPVSNGDEVYLKGIANQWGAYVNWSRYNTNINSTANINASGNAMSLLYGDDFTDKTSFQANSTYNLYGLFVVNEHLVDAGQLELPATTLAENCYSDMFSHCSKLTSAPALPATPLAKSCYNGMFDHCTSLTAAPALPATTLTQSCYGSMFNGCTSLTSAPALPATTLAFECCNSMFNGCTSLTSAPALPATTLAEYCYRYMFSGCTSLTSAPALPATTLKNSCYNQMFRGCSSLTTAPALPATTLAQECYSSMFNGCSKLNNITMLATDISASQCLRDWVTGVAATGTFTKAAAMTTLPSGASGIPANWTVVDAA